MGFHQSPAHQETKPNPLNPFDPAAFQTLEGRKEFSLVLLGYAYTLVADADNQMI
jgi:hypothetical protein